MISNEFKVGRQDNQFDEYRLNGWGEVECLLIGAVISGERPSVYESTGVGFPIDSDSSICFPALSKVKIEPFRTGIYDVV